MAAYDVNFGSNSGVQVAHNSGTIIYTAAKRKLDKAFYVPDILSPNFVGREDELQRIIDIHRVSSRCIIYGMPGLEKTQVALKYADATKGEYSYVFWLSATTIERFESGFSELIGHVFENTNKTISNTRRWLEEDNKWLLVIDNVSCEALSSLRSILPRKGSILFTTRFEHVAHSLCSSEHRIELQVLSSADSINLFIETRKFLEQETVDYEAINLIVKKVGHLPLAIDQAASLSVAPGQSIASVLEIYQGPDILEAMTWDNDLGLHEQPSVFCCFKPILNQVQQDSPAAFEILSLLAFLDPENISLGLLEQGLEGNELRTSLSPELQADVGNHFQRLRSTFRSPIQKQKAIQILTRSSLIKYKAAKAFWIHDVIYLLLHRYFLDKQQQRLIWLSIAVNMIFNALTHLPGYTSYRDRPQVLSFVTHVEQLRKHLDKYGHDSLEFIGLEANMATFFWERGRYETAEEIEKQALLKYTKLVGETHARTLSAMSNLATTYMSQGRWKDAEILQSMLVERSKLKYGLIHDRTLRCLGDLAINYAHQDRLDEAVQLNRTILDISMEHPDLSYVEYAYRLAELLMRQQQWPEVERLERMVFEIRRSELGAEDPSTLFIMSNMATTIQLQGRWEEAEALLLSAVEIHDRVLGSDDSRSLKCKQRLAGGFVARNRMAEVFKLIEIVIEGFEKTLGGDHEFTKEAKTLQTKWNEWDLEHNVARSSLEVKNADAVENDGLN